MEEEEENVIDNMDTKDIIDIVRGKAESDDNDDEDDDEQGSSNAFGLFGDPSAKVEEQEVEEPVQGGGGERGAFGQHGGEERGAFGQKPYPASATVVKKAPVLTKQVLESLNPYNQVVGHPACHTELCMLLCCHANC